MFRHYSYKMIDKFIHKFLKVPYTLHSSVKKRSKKPVASILFLHGIGRSGESWQGVIDKLPQNYEILSIDLLGFGKSPKPHWAEYSAKLHARSVVATLLKSRPRRRPIIVVGHSLGSLVAVEMAKRYKIVFDKLILCSPPFYRDQSSSRALSRDGSLKNLYKTLVNHPERFLEASRLATKYKLITGPLTLSNDNIEAYMSALEATIINQTSLEDAKSLKVPMQIIHGAFDPLVVKKNLKHLVAHNNKAQLRVVRAGHEVKSQTYKDAVAEEIISAVKQYEMIHKKSKSKSSKN